METTIPKQLPVEVIFSCFIEIAKEQVQRKLDFGNYAVFNDNSYEIQNDFINFLLGHIRRNSLSAKSPSYLYGGYEKLVLLKNFNVFIATNAGSKQQTICVNLSEIGHSNTTLSKSFNIHSVEDLRIVKDNFDVGNSASIRTVVKPNTISIVNNLINTTTATLNTSMSVKQPNEFEDIFNTLASIQSTIDKRIHI